MCLFSVSNIFIYFYVLHLSGMGLFGVYNYNVTCNVLVVLCNVNSIISEVFERFEKKEALFRASAVFLWKSTD